MNKKALILYSLIFINIFGFISPNVSYAEKNTIQKDVGNLHIKTDSEIKEEAKHVPKEAKDYEYKYLQEVGNFKIKAEPSLQVKPKKITTQEEIKILEKLDKIISYQNKKKYEEALEEMKTLAREYPENGVFYKWVAIYENSLRNYEESSSVIEQLRMMFPLSSNTVDNDFMIRYYEIDNARNTNKKEVAQKLIDQLKTDNQVKNSNKIIYDIKEKDLTNFLCQYQNFLLNNKNYKDVDRKELTNLWKQIPKRHQRTLDDFYGYNIDDLTYIYGRAFNRKDLLKEYVEHEKENKDTIIIQQVKDAKKILYSKY